MLANVLLALGAALLLTGAWLKWRHEPAPAPPAETRVAPELSVDLSIEDKGLQFEKWVVDRFPARSFVIKHWRSDTISDGVRYTGSDPDVEVDMVLGDRHYRFAVECKWLSTIAEGLVPLAEPHQLQNYRHYASQADRPVFVVLGVGGRPSAPAELFIVPVQVLEEGAVNAERLRTLFKQSMSRQGFFFDVTQATLKY